MEGALPTPTPPLSRGLAPTPLLAPSSPRSQADSVPLSDTPRSLTDVEPASLDAGSPDIVMGGRSTNEEEPVALLCEQGGASSAPAPADASAGAAPPATGLSDCCNALGSAGPVAHDDSVDSGKCTRTAVADPVADPTPAAVSETQQRVADSLAPDLLESHTSDAASVPAAGNLQEPPKPASPHDTADVPAPRLRVAHDGEALDDTELLVDTPTHVTQLRRGDAAEDDDDGLGWGDEEITMEAVALRCRESVQTSAAGVVMLKARMKEMRRRRGVAKARRRWARIRTTVKVNTFLRLVNQHVLVTDKGHGHGYQEVHVVPHFSEFKRLIAKLPVSTRDTTAL